MNNNQYFRFTFYVDDGYAGVKSRPYHCRVHREDFSDLSADEFETAIEDAVREHIQANFYPVYEIEDIYSEFHGKEVEDSDEDES